MNLSEEIKTCYSLTDFCKRLNLSTGGGGFKKAKKIVDDNKLDISHFNNGKKRKYEVVEKICPVCNNKFETQLGERKEKTTCSHSCSNTYFRSGKDNGNWSDNSYRSTCFLYHKKECVVCGENKIVEVHHMDENRKNNSPENLVPLCPTHHQYWHSRYKQEIENKIFVYLKNKNYEMNLDTVPTLMSNIFPGNWEPVFEDDWFSNFIKKKMPHNNREKSRMKKEGISNLESENREGKLNNIFYDDPFVERTKQDVIREVDSVESYSLVKMDRRIVGFKFYGSEKQCSDIQNEIRNYSVCSEIHKKEGDECYLYIRTGRIKDVDGITPDAYNIFRFINNYKDGKVATDKYFKNKKFNK